VAREEGADRAGADDAHALDQAVASFDWR
jgi:hypothetical protein